MKYKVNFKFSFGLYLIFFIKNALIILFSFGLLIPLVFFNMVKFVTDNSEIIKKEEYPKGIIIDKKYGKML